LREDAAIRRNSAYPLADRLFIGGLKNLLAGVTTVAHHNPIYRDLRGRFPVRVVKAFGWAHSLALEGMPVGAGGEPGPSVCRARRDTPSDVPFIVHAAEGIDAAAVDEIRQLEELGCLRAGTVLVHGVAVTVSKWRRLLDAGVSLVWCPASNAFLFGTTIPARDFLDASANAASRFCLATDSRLTGSQDLLDEMRVAVAAASLTASEVVRMVTLAPAQILKLPAAGHIAVANPADLIVVPPSRETAHESLLNARRADLWCVILAGEPLIATRRFCGVVRERAGEPRPLTIDGVEHIAAASLVRDLGRCAIQEPGVASVA
jgi:hypothetical protein